MGNQSSALEGVTLRHGRTYKPTATHNQMAWAAVESVLKKPGGHSYEELKAAAYRAARKVGHRFIDYLVSNGWLVSVG